MAKGHLELEVKFTKLKNGKVKYQLPVKMVCSHGDTEIPNSMTLTKDDGLIKLWLGNSDKAFGKRNVIFKKVNLSQAYDDCDKVKSKV